MRMLVPPRRGARIIVATVALLGTIRTNADEPLAKLPASKTGAVEYVRDVRPILAGRCYDCHGAAKQKGGLRLDRKAEALVGGGSGRAFEPSKSGESLLIDLVSGADPDLVMPPKGDRLTSKEIEMLRAWIDQGASWPDEAVPAKTSAPRSNHWAFQPIRRPELPRLKDVAGIRNEIDVLVRAALEAREITPAPEADRPTLLRRLSLDLLGLPPKPEDVDAFDKDKRPDAYERQVERLLASPHFGERWGRHWLDLARYADSDGYEKDSPRPNAWRFRNWVIDAINRDLPFDRFTTEQLAGDMLLDADLSTRTATGFHRNTLTNREGGVDQEEYRIKAVVDRVNTTGTVWLGLTIACAQCHTHKYDPILQREYYGLFAFFNGQREDDLPVPDSKAAPSGKAANAGPRIPVLVANPKPPKTHVLIRGDFLRQGDEVVATTPAVLPPLAVSGRVPNRLDLARWLVDRNHPLTSRVEANRIWTHLFGRGLVATPDDFGTRGEPPTHPALLDWLASELMDRGWSRKALIRLIVHSATYRQSSANRPDLLDSDPNNLWLARQNRARLEAEILRDVSLAASGLLAPTIGGQSVHPPQPAGIAELTYAGSAHWVESMGTDRYRRGLYTWFQRTSPYPMLMTFDAPDANVCAVKRERSNTPIQALTLLNDATFVECARALGRLASSAPNPESGIHLLFRRSLARVPSDEEIALLKRLYDGFRVDATEADAWFGVARTVMNLDEFVTRE